MTRYLEGEPYSGNRFPPSTPYVEKSEGRTRQDDLERSKIGNIISKYKATGELPRVNRESFFADVSGVPSFQEAIAIVDRAREGFMQLPAELRAKHDNDAGKFVDWTSDPANRQEMVKMGLLDAPDEVTKAAAVAGDEARKPVEKVVEKIVEKVVEATEPVT